MNHLNHHLLLRTKEDVDYMWKLYNRDDEKTVKEKINAVEVWMKGEPHLAEASKYIGRPYLETMYLLGKCSTEATKRKLEKILTMKTLMPEFYDQINIEEFDNLLQTVSYVLLPKVNPSDRSRVSVVKFLTDDLEDFQLIKFFRYTAMLADYRAYYDFSIHETIILDFSNISLLSILTKLNPVLMKKIDIISAEYGIKIKGIHIISTSNYVEKLVSLLKQTLRPKVAGRLHVHTNYESLYKYIPKEIIPGDFGGDGMSCASIAEKWAKELRTDEVRKVFDDIRRLTSDESKRSTYAFNEEYLGMPGSFRTLSVD